MEDDVLADYNGENIGKFSRGLFSKRKDRPEPVDDVWQEFDQYEDPSDH